MPIGVPQCEQLVHCAIRGALAAVGPVETSGRAQVRCAADGCPVSGVDRHHPPGVTPAPAKPSGTTRRGVTPAPRSLPVPPAGGDARPWRSPPVALSNLALTLRG